MKQMENKKKQFIFSLEWAEVLMDFPPEIRYQTYDAIMQYMASGCVVDLSPTARMAFAFIKKELDFYQAKYEATVEARRAAGRKGGRAKKKIPTAKSQSENELGSIEASEPETGNAAGEIIEEEADDRSKTGSKALCLKDSEAETFEAEFAKQKKQSEANASDIELELDIDNNIKSFPKVKDSSAAADLPSDSDVDFNALKDFFNSEMDRRGSRIPKINVISAARRKSIRCRCRQHGKEALMRVIEKAATSDFLNGSVDFVASFDWLLKPNNFIKTLEGNYDNKTAPARAGQSVYPAGNAANPAGAAPRGKIAIEYGLYGE